MSVSNNKMNQKFELRGFTVFFHINDSLAAENLLDSLDRASPILSTVFNLTEEPKGNFRLLKTPSDLGATALKCKAGDPVYVDGYSGVLYLFLDRLGGLAPGEVGVRELARLLFNRSVNEREISIKRYRTPSWLIEGFVLQGAYRIRTDHIDWLRKGWASLQVAHSSRQLIKPSLMENDICLIPDPKRRQLALFQSFYMVKLLLSIYCDSFFSKYSTLMRAIEDMEAESCFRQITNFGFDKFFVMFEAWVKNTNAWAAME